MSRSNYTEDGSNWDYICWSGAVNSAIKGKRGQHFIKEALMSLEIMKDKRLITEEFKSHDGCYCTLGVLAKNKNIDVSNINPEDSEAIAKIFNVSKALIKEIVYQNDEGGWNEEEEPEERWIRMRKWLLAKII